MRLTLNVSGRATALGLAAILAASAALPAEAKRDRSERSQSAAQAKAPLTLVVSLEAQRLDVYRGSTLLKQAPVSTGRKGYATPTGIFSILQKRRWHRSNIYSRAPMPFMQRLTWSGIALHAGPLPGYPASHGCIRLPSAFATDLFRLTRLGAHVVVVQGTAAPRPIEHAALFQPRPPADLASPDQAPSRKAASEVMRLAEAGETGVASSLSDAAAVSSPPESSEPTAFEAYAERAHDPLRILITRRVGRERIMDMQGLLKELGHDPGDIDGLMGPDTARAIKAFQAQVGLPTTGAQSDELIEMLYHATGVAEPVNGHIYVRQGFKPLFDAPIRLREAEAPLGTHLFTATHFEDGERSVEWLLVTAQGGSEATAEQALGRIDLPSEVRQRVETLLTPGSSLIVSDLGLGLETGAKGTDFIVVTDE